MSYIGNTVQNQNYVPAIDYFNGNGSTTAFTLSRPVASVAAVQAVISNVPQNPGSAFTVSGSTITFTSAPPSGTSNIYVYYTSPNTQVVQPGQGTVGTTQLADASVTTAKLSSTTGTGAVALASLPSFTTTIGVGGATASASGSGVSFPATQSASSDANTLDDYEEGTFTPGMKFGTGNTGMTFSVQNGIYRKVGALVFFSIGLALSAKGSSTGTAYITGLPFTSGDNGSYSDCAVSWAFQRNMAANTTGLAGVARNNTIIQFSFTTTTGSNDLTDTAFTNTSQFNVSGCYFVPT